MDPLETPASSPIPRNENPILNLTSSTASTTPSHNSCDDSSSSSDDESSFFIPPLFQRNFSTSNGSVASHRHVARRLYLSRTDYLEADNMTVTSCANDTKSDVFLYSEKIPLIQKDALFSPKHTPWWAEDDSVSTANKRGSAAAAAITAYQFAINIIAPTWFILSIIHFCLMFLFDTLSNPPWVSSYGLFLNPLVGPGELTLLRFGVLLSCSEPWRVFSNVLACAHLPQFITTILSYKLMNSIKKRWSREKVAILFLLSTMSQILVPVLSGGGGAGGSVLPLAVLSAHGVECFVIDGVGDWSNIAMVVAVCMGLGVTSYMSVWIQLCGVVPGLGCGLYWFFYRKRRREEEEVRNYSSPLLGLGYDESDVVSSSQKKLGTVLLFILLAGASLVFPLFASVEECAVRHVVLGNECLQSCLHSHRLEENSCLNVGFEYLSALGRDVDVYSRYEVQDVTYFGVGRLAVEDAY